MPDWPADGLTLVERSYHDLNHATRHVQHLVALKSGAVVVVGDSALVVAPDLLRVVFGIEGDVIPDPRTGLPLCISYRLAA
jgi:iron complex transport system ATP-binding protein